MPHINTDCTLYAIIYTTSGKKLPLEVMPQKPMTKKEIERGLLKSLQTMLDKPVRVEVHSYRPTL